MPPTNDEYADFMEDMRDHYPWADQDEIDQDAQDRRAFQEELIRIRKETF